MEVNRLVLHVERLVLNGFQPQDREALTQAVRGELGRQMAAPDLVRAVASRSDTDHVRVGELVVPRTLRPEQVGAWIARAIARGLRP